MQASERETNSHTVSDPLHIIILQYDYDYMNDYMYDYMKGSLTPRGNPFPATRDSRRARPSTGI